MGRTSARKVMRIVELRGLGYTQQEIATKMKIDVKTVRKYDPNRNKAGSNRTHLESPGEAPQPNAAERVTAIESRLSQLEEHLRLASAYLLLLIHHGSSQEYREEDPSPQNFREALEDSKDNDEAWCPFCGGGHLCKRSWGDFDFYYVCDACGKTLIRYSLFDISGP